MDKNGNKIIGYVGIIFGVILTPLVILMNKYLLASEPMILTYFASIVFIIMGIYLVIKNKKINSVSRTKIVLTNNCYRRHKF